MYECDREKNIPLGEWIGGKIKVQKKMIGLFRDSGIKQLGLVTTCL